MSPTKCLTLRGDNYRFGPNKTPFQISDSKADQLDKAAHDTFTKASAVAWPSRLFSMRSLRTPSGY